MQSLKIACLCLVLITGPVILDSCSCHFDQEYYDIDDLTLIVTTFPAAEPYPVATGSSLTLKNIAFGIKLDVTFMTSVIGTTSGFTAVACEPPLPLGKQNISSILISSSAIFTTRSQTVPAGLSLNEFFGAYYYKDRYPIDYVFNPMYPEPFALRTDVELSKPQIHRFFITITLDDGRVFRLVTDPLELNEG